MGPRTAWDRCADDGPGAEDLSQLNIVSVTGKKDGVIQRGRMGRGFKELLSIATGATVRSRDQELLFTVDEDGSRRVVHRHGLDWHHGFEAAMQVEHDEAETDRGMDAGAVAQSLSVMRDDPTEVLNVSHEGELSRWAAFETGGPLAPDHVEVHFGLALAHVTDGESAAAVLDSLAQAPKAPCRPRSCGSAPNLDPVCRAYKHLFLNAI